MLSSPIEAYSKVPPTPRTCGSRDRAHQHHIFATFARLAGRERGSPTRPAGPCIAGGRPLDATRGGAHPRHPLVRWDDPRLETPPPRAAVAPVLRSPFAHPTGGGASSPFTDPVSGGYRGRGSAREVARTLWVMRACSGTSRCSRLRPRGLPQHSVCRANGSPRGPWRGDSKRRPSRL